MAGRVLPAGQRRSPPPDQVDELLALAATAAHSSERIAAPLACWAGGVSGRPASELGRIADEIS